jgi:hypothetical protein
MSLRDFENDITYLTEGTLDGEGVFDRLMAANKAHLDAEFSKNRIKGPEYSQVYLGAMTAVMQAALAFLLQKKKTALECEVLEQQKANAILEGNVLVAQECKLRAEFDLIVANKLKTQQETSLLAQKIVTERAQTLSTGVDADSVVGRQKELYSAQTAGFTRDSEQKAAKIMIDTWNVRRTTDEGTVASQTNRLQDADIGRVVSKLIEGIGA